MKLTKRILSLFLCMVMILGMIPVIASAEEMTATITFDDTSKRTVFTTSQAVWEENGVTVTNNKGSGSNIADYSNPLRIYAKSEVIIAHSKPITKIEITCNASKYVSPLTNSITSTSDTVTTSGNVVTIELAEPATSYTIASISAQTRFNSLTVTYTADSTGDEGGETPVCEHANLNAAIHVNGEHVVTCADCGEYTVTEAHTMSDWTVKTPASYSAPGEEIKTCSGCEYTESREIAQLVVDGNHYVKYTGELVTGNYILVVSGYALGAYDSDTKWVLTTTAPIIDENTVTDDEGGVWTLTVTDAGVILTDANGVSIAPVAGDDAANGISTGEYTWNVISNDDGTYTFTGTGDDTNILAANKTSSYKFRSYKQGTVSGNPEGYPSNFTLYKLQEEAHTCEYEAVVTAPTCTAGGYTTYTCGTCGDTYTADEVAALGHDYDEGVVTTDPTCEDKGTKTFTCGTCSDSYTEEVAATGHSYVGEVTQEPTLNAEGIKTYTCSGCGDSYTETLAKLEGAVAEINGYKYATLQEAVNVGGEITLLTDVELTETLVIPAGKVVTLNLAGYTISQTKECTASYSMIENKGSLTITGNGKISFTDTGAGDPAKSWGAYTIHNAGTLVVENGTIENLSAQNQAGAAFAHTTLAIFQYSGSTTINGGVISGPYYRSVRLWSGDMTINGGTFEGQVWVQCVNDTAELTINGGTFAPRWNDASSVFVNNAYSGKSYVASLAITDGIFTTKIGANSPATLVGDKVTGGTFYVAVPEAFCAEGFIPTENADGTYGVEVGSYVAQIGDVKYTSLQDAIDAAGVGDTVVLLANTTVSKDGVTVNKTVTVDLNGNTVSSEGDVFVVVAGTLTINDSSENKTGAVAGGTSGVGSWTAIWANGGEVIVNGGIYSVGGDTASTDTTHQNDVVYTKNGGKVTINGGAFLNNGTVWTLNENDSNRGTITVNGGKFQNWNPYNNVSEGVNTNFVVEGSHAMDADGDGYFTIDVHSYNAVVTNPTCTDKGYTTYTCACGDSYVTDETAATGHTEGTAVKENWVSPSANADGSYDKVVYCSVCGEELSRESVVVEMPDATVTVMDSMILTEADDYMCWPNGDDTVDRLLQIVMNFKANETLEQAMAGEFGKYICDFYLTFEGLSGDSIISDNCYLAGNYGDYGWIVIPVDGLELEEGVTYPIVSAYDANLTYENVCDYVKSFTAAIYIDPAILAANPDMTVTLELRMTNPENAEDVLVIGEPAVYTVADLTAGNAEAQIGSTYYATLQEALDAAIEGDTVKLLANAELNALLVMPGVTLDLNGYTVEANYVVGFNGSAIIDSSAANTGLVKVAQDRVMLDLNNSQLPVYNNELGGYLFLEINIVTNLVEDTENDVATFKFYIKKDLDYMMLLDLMRDGAADNNLTVMVKLSWTTLDGNSATQYYAYSEDMNKHVAEVHSTSKYSTYTCELKGINSRESITYAAVLQSVTGAELTFAG